MREMVSKVCAKCLRRKPADAFRKRPERATRGSGLSSRCRECLLEDAKARYKPHPKKLLSFSELRRRRSERAKRHYVAHRRRILKAHFNWKAKNKAAVKKANKRWFKRNKSRIAGRVARYFSIPGNRELQRERVRVSYRKKRAEYLRKHRLWKSQNKDRVNLIGQKRRAALRGAPVNDFTFEQWNAKKKLYGFRCVYCGKKKKLTQDHLRPLSKGGGHTDLNIVPACGPCNSRKKDGPPLPFFLSVSNA
jgi:5-methylcytosine-specific restriction endonuclease McrA